MTEFSRFAFLIFILILCFVNLSLAWRGISPKPIDGHSRIQRSPQFSQSSAYSQSNSNIGGANGFGGLPPPPRPYGSPQFRDGRNNFGAGGSNFGQGGGNYRPGGSNFQQGGGRFNQGGNSFGGGFPQRAGQSAALSQAISNSGSSVPGIGSNSLSISISASGK